jgi:hypothetical protein
MEEDMAYDPEMDKVLKKWKCDETGLVLTINQYGQGEPKLQIGPRILLKKDGSERAPVKAGRLTMEDLIWLYDNIDEIKDELSALAKPV